MSDTPRTDAVFFSATTEKPSSGDFELEVVYKEFAQKLERECNQLAAWKESALVVESRWDCQSVAKLLGIGLGQDIRPNIEPKIRALLEILNDRDETIKNLEARVYDLRAQFIEADHHRCVLRTAAEALCEAWHDEHAQSSNIEPLVDALDSAVRMAPDGDSALHQVETALNDALVENAKLWDVVKHDSGRMQAMMTQLASAGIAPPP